MNLLYILGSLAAIGLLLWFCSLFTEADDDFDKGKPISEDIHRP